MQELKHIQTRDAGVVSDLLCPRCGADNLHHCGVILYERREDGDPLLRVTLGLQGEPFDAQRVSQVSEMLPADQSGNPSSRRNGLAVEFYCEQCGGGTDEDRIELTIAQHKGSTEIGWRFTPKGP